MFYFSRIVFCSVMHAIGCCLCSWGIRFIRFGRCRISKSTIRLRWLWQRYIYQSTTFVLIFFLSSIFSFARVHYLKFHFFFFKLIKCELGHLQMVLTLYTKTTITFIRFVSFIIIGMLTCSNSLFVLCVVQNKIREFDSNGNSPKTLNDLNAFYSEFPIKKKFH